MLPIVCVCFRDRNYFTIIIIIIIYRKKNSFQKNFEKLQSMPI